ncbi:NADPH:quinone oxidoreductase family protein [Pseudooceanicola aestuarii]|uniref:NADPH:quinone oxidoreductase family protein n=1 Tax=Pseudooceanicola aestuarii TaxID=2697319 RepID=UPI0013CFA1CE|nr:NADPH:quinone oxidoreductase family protein [Pseudooceanicola aestuarii]
MTLAPTLPDGRQIVVTEFADDPAQAIETGLDLRVQPAPRPEDLGPNEALLEIRSAALSWVDLLMTSGQYQHMPKPPYVPGMEYAGVVRAVGPDVAADRCAVGDRMLVDSMHVGPRSHGDYQAAGGLASYAVVSADLLLPIPGDLDFDQAAVLLQAYETAYHCLVARANLQPGETILINGATGLTGLAAVEMARMLGATVIATGRSAEKLKKVEEVGAHHVVTVLDKAGQVRRFRDDVKALTGGRGVDVVYDAVGGDISLESLRCTAFNARFLIVGWTSTPDVARGRGQRGAPNANHLPTNIIQMKSLIVMGCPSAIAVAKDPSIRPERLARILQWAGEGKIRPQISHLYVMDEFRDAFRARWNGEVTGGCVLRMG